MSQAFPPIDHEKINAIENKIDELNRKVDLLSAEGNRSWVQSMGLTFFGFAIALFSLSTYYTDSGNKLLVLSLGLISLFSSAVIMLYGYFNKG